MNEFEYTYDEKLLVKTNKYKISEVRNNSNDTTYFQVNKNNENVGFLEFDDVINYLK